MFENRPIEDDGLSNTMCLVEQIINAKPMTPVSYGLNSLDAVTLNDFSPGNKKKLFAQHTMRRRVC